MKYFIGFSAVGLFAIHAIYGEPVAAGILTLEEARGLALDAGLDLVSEIVCLGGME